MFQTRLGGAIATLMGMACVTAGAIASAATADSSPSDNDSYTLTSTPSVVAGASTTTFTVTLLNSSGNGEPLNNASVTAPTGLRLLHGASAPGEKGSVKVSGDTATLHNLSTPPGHAFELRLTARAPVDCGRVTGTWGSSAWEDDPRFPQGHEPLSLTGAPAKLDVVSPCSRRYAFVVSPGPVEGGAVAHLRLALYNRSSPGITLGSADVGAPGGFRILSASLATGRRGHVEVTRGGLLIRGVHVRPGETLELNVTAVAPAHCGSLVESWRSAVRQAPSFAAQPLRLLRSASKRTTSVTTTCLLTFGAEPHSALVGQHITGSDYDTGGSPVSVKIVDPSGDVVTSSNGPVTLTLNQPSGAGATLAGATAQVSAGRATFPNLQIDRPDNGYTLSTTNPQGWGPATSSSFNVTNRGQPCAQDHPCATDLTSVNGNSSGLAASPQTGPNSGFLEESIDIGTTHSLDCSSPARGGYTTLNPDTFAFKMSPSTNRTEVWTSKLVHTIPPIDGQTITDLLAPPQECYGSQTDFTMANGVLAPPGTLPDGSAGFVGTLPNCVSPGSFGPTGGPCIDQANVQRPLDLSNGIGFDVIVPVDVPKGQGDPMRH